MKFHIVIKLFLLLIPTLSLPKSGWSIPRDSAYVVLLKCLEKNNAINKSRIDITTTMSRKNEKITSASSTFIKYDDFTSLKSMETISIREKNSSVMVDKQGQTISFYRLETAKSPGFHVDVTSQQLQQLMPNTERSRFVISAKNSGFTTVTIITTSNSPYIKIDIVIDNVTMLLSKALYYFAKPETAGLDKIEMIYKYSTVGKEDIPSECRMTNYVKIEKNGASLQPAFKKFRLLQ